MNHYYESLKFIDKSECNHNELPNKINKLIKQGYKISKYFGFIVASTLKDCLPLEFYFNVNNFYTVKNRRLNTNYDISDSIEIYNECIKNNLEPTLENYYNNICEGKILCN